MKKTSVCTFLALLLSLSLLNASSVNRSIRVDRGEKIKQSLKSVNGSIHIADDVEINGDCRTVNGSITLNNHVHIEGICQTVNGSIRIGDGCRMDEVRTTNGRIEIGKNCEISGNIRTTNGRLTLENGTSVKGELRTINGDIDLQGVELEEDIYISNGAIRIASRSSIKGNIIITPSSSSSFSFFGLFRRSKRHQKIIEVTVRDHSIVWGDIIVKNDNRPVIVYIGNNAEVKGKIINAEKRSL